MKTEALGHPTFIFSVHSDIWWVVVVMQPLKGEGLNCYFTLKKNIHLLEKRESEVEETNQILMEI